jgi:curved DNA-binding protein CbpA
MKNYYNELGIERSASNAEIIDAAKKLVKLNNLENFTDPQEIEKAREKLKAVKLAYETLKDEHKKFEYDLELDEKIGIKNQKVINENPKKGNFKLVLGLFFGSVIITAGATTYLNKLDCTNIKNSLDSAVCEKTKPIRDIFSSPEKNDSPVTSSENKSVSNSTEIVEQSVVETQETPKLAPPVETTQSVETIPSQPQPVNQVNVEVVTPATSVPTNENLHQEEVKTVQNTTVPSQNLISSNVSTPALQTVISEGVGTDPQSASQNAAENALKNVVGSFMDTNSRLEKRTLIDNGIHAETKNISNDVKEYSQGSIKSFEVLEVKQEAGLFRVSAKVTVRNETFGAYIQQVAKGEISVNNDKLSEAASKIEAKQNFENISNNIESKNKENVDSILKDKIINPLLTGEAQEIILDEPIVVSDALKSNLLNSSVKEILENVNQNYLLLPITVKLKDDFFIQVQSVLNQISSEKKILDVKDYKNIRSQSDTDIGSCKTSNSMFCLGFFESNNSDIFNMFIFKGQKDIVPMGAILWNLVYSSDKNILRIVLQDNQNSTLVLKNINQKSLNELYTQNSGKIKVELPNGIIFIKSPITDDDIYNRVHTPWLLLRQFSKRDNVIDVHKIIYKNTFYVLLDVDVDVMKKTNKILVTLEK